MINENKIVGLIAMSNLKGIGPAFIKKSVSVSDFSSLDLAEELKTITSANKKQFDNDSIIEKIEEAKDIYFNCSKENIAIITCFDSRYPNLLKELKDPPALIYCKGNLDLLKMQTVGIIGTREPNESGILIASRVGDYFEKSNWAICNGLAEGIDSYSVKLNNRIRNNVIGVLAGGLNFNSRKTLLNKTAENANLTLDNDGLLISEIAPSIKEDTFSVVKSCRIQAGLSLGMIMIQSSLEGGSRFTLKAFCETTRPIGVVNPIPADYLLPSYMGNIEIIENKKKGLSRFVDLKDEKIQTKDIVIIRSKDDYKEFENIMAKNNGENNLFSGTLF